LKRIAGHGYVLHECSKWQLDLKARNIKLSAKESLPIRPPQFAGKRVSKMAQK
jgi:hypothetical protein